MNRRRFNADRDIRLDGDLLQLNRNATVTKIDAGVSVALRKAMYSSIRKDFSVLHRV